MVSWLGENAADKLIYTLIGVLGFLVLRDFDQQARLARVETVIVKEARVEHLEGRIDRCMDALTNQRNELTRLRQGINDLLVPVISEDIKDDFKGSNSGDSDDGGGDGGG